MDILLQELVGTLPDAQHLARVTVRMIAALLVGALIGMERERTGKAAGLRTHMLVALGTTLFVVAASEVGMHEDAMSRVLQGLITGIGFLGAGTILKLEDRKEIKGLTTAAGVWMTAAASVAIGLGHIVTAFIGTLLACLVLTALKRLERRIGPNTDQ